MALVVIAELCARLHPRARRRAGHEYSVTCSAQALLLGRNLHVEECDQFNQCSSSEVHLAESGLA